MYSVAVDTGTILILCIGISRAFSSESPPKNTLHMHLYIYISKISLIIGLMGESDITVALKRE